MQIDPAELKAVPQDDIIRLVRLLRALVTNLGIYPAGHAIVQQVAQRVCDTADTTRATSGRLLASADASMLTVNRESIFKTCDEQDYSVMLSSWLRERAVDNLLFEEGLTAAELLKVFSWLYSTPVPEVRQAMLTGLPDEVRVDHLIANVRAPKSDRDIREAIETMDFAPLFEKAGMTGNFEAVSEDQALDVDEIAAAVKEKLGAQEVDLTHATGQLSSESINWDSVDFSRVVDPDQLATMIDQSNLGDYVQRYLAEHVSSGVTGADLDELVEQAARNLERSELPDLDTQVATSASRLLKAMLPEAIGEYLASQLPTGPTAQKLRLGVLSSLGEDGAQQAQVLDELTVTLAGVRSAGEAVPILRSMEELLPRMLKGQDLDIVVQAFATIKLLAEPDHRAGAARRARGTLDLVASPEVIGELLHRTQHAPSHERDMLRQLLAALAPAAVPQLLEFLRTSIRRQQRLLVVDLLSELGWRATLSGEGAVDVLSPALRELDRHSDHPWYFTRNLAAILARSGDPAVLDRLTRLMRADLDPRVITEILRGLAQADSDQARKAGRRVLARVQDPGGLAVALPWLLRVDPENTMATALDLLEAEPSAEQAEGILVGLALGVGVGVVPLVQRVLGQRKGLLRRPQFDEPTRLAAVEALGCLQEAEARALLVEAGKDPSSAVRRRAAELQGTPVDEVKMQAKLDLGLEVPR